MDPAAPLLLFDSGVGGLSVLAELRKALPDAPVIYAADNAGLPYGGKSEAEIAARVCGLLGRMAERYRPRLICIACNTASTIALAMVRDVLEAEFAADKRLLRFAAPELVMAAEAKLRGQAVDAEVYARAAEGLRTQPGGADIDVVVLACTHFPLVADELADAFGPGASFVHGAAGIARRISHLTEGQPFRRVLPDLALFTRQDDGIASLLPALEHGGLNRVDIL
jgi:glutamate racemase